MRVGEVCNRIVVVVEADASIREAAKVMRKYHVGNVIVVDRSSGEVEPVGVLTDRDLVVELLAQDVDLDAVAVQDAMSFDLLTAREDEDDAEVLSRMRTRGVRRVPVVDKSGALVGILSVDDYLSLMSDQLSELVALIGIEQKRERWQRP